MKRIMGLLVCCSLVMAAVLCVSKPARAVDPSQIDPSEYPSLSNKEIGHLLWYSKIAGREISDFSDIPLPPTNMVPGTAHLQFRESAYRYQLAFMVYFLAMEQHFKLSACQDVIKPKMDRLIQKMLQRDVWDYWGEWTSKGLFVTDANLSTPYPERHDPVGEENVMYSGHLAQMVGLYEKLYRDLKWAEEGSMVFAWAPDEAYYYDTHSLQQALLKQSLSEQVCIECEPNLCFAPCNTHPILAYGLYDQVYGTDHFAQTKDRFVQWLYDKGIISPDTHEVAAMFLIEQDMPVIDDHISFGNALDALLAPLTELGLLSANLGVNDAWTGAFMHAIEPDLIDRLWPYWKENHIYEVAGKGADVRPDLIADQSSLGFFSILAADMGELDLRDKLVRMGELRYRPRWGADGTYRYPYFTDQLFSLGPIARFSANGVTEKLISIGTACPTRDCMRKLHFEPYVGNDPETPQVVGLDFPKIILRRAIFDPAKKALVITTDSPYWQRAKSFKPTSFQVTRLDPSKRWIVQFDGQKTTLPTGSKLAKISVQTAGQHNIIISAI